MSRKNYHLLSFIFALILLSCKSTQKTTSTTAVENLLPGLLNDPFFDTLIRNKSEYKVQIIYTQVDRDKNNEPMLTDHMLNVNKDDYFYPASTVKFPIAILALQKLNELNIPGLDRNTPMITETGFSAQSPVYNDPTSVDGSPSIAHYIKKILLVSDNDASNRLYEFLGQEYINNTLHNMGYDDAQIIHRLSIFMTEEENRNTNPIKFVDTSGKLIYAKPAERSGIAYAERNTFLGKGYYSGDELKNEPFNFSKKNRLALQTLHSLMRSVIFPNSVPKEQRFNLKEDDRQFLLKYMSMFSNESNYPSYDTAEYGPNYIKFILAGAQKEPIDPNIRIFSKSGQAYGFLTDVTYITDSKNNIEFFVTATIHCNSDGIYNDDHYDYDTIGFPFMKKLGEVLYKHELERKGK